MHVAAIDEQTLKAILKAAIVEVLEERREVVHDILAEVLEDVGLAMAIDEGIETETVSQSDLFAALN